jgi:hypothetical protein
MRTKKEPKKQTLTPEQIDEIVTSQAGDEGAWENPVEVKRNEAGSFSIPPELAERAAFLARVHRSDGLQNWLTKVIRERIELEEGAYAAAKRELKGGSGLHS